MGFRYRLYRRVRAWGAAALVAAIIILAGAPAEAAEAFLVRTGEHESFIRVVVETAAPMGYTVTTEPDGTHATILLSGTPEAPAKIQARDTVLTIQTAPAEGGKTAVNIAFRRPIALKSSGKLDPEGGGGYRIVVDFAYAGAAAPLPKPAAEPPKEAPPQPARPTPSASAAPPEVAPPTAKPGGESVFILSGFRSARFGATVPDVIEAIRQDFHVGRDRLTEDSDKVTLARRLTLTLDGMLPGTRAAQLAYRFAPGSDRLIAVEITWGCPPVGNGLSDAEDRAITEPLTKLFRKIDYPPDRVVINQGLPDGATLVFQGRDVGERSSRLLRRVLPSVNGEARACLALSYRTPEAGP